ncbi:MAG: methionyl-tRNA formyltransferase, partial [Ignavibacterium sp.]|uniref:methionyl-tRNA formyltransferase n=1 Tax=Ignavibacterium sp. TaxID=2651167 RepID=UPI00404B041C
MKIIFMGTPQFAIPSLKAIYESKHQLLAVVTTPDRERGRGQKITFTAVKQFAIDNNIPVYQPEKLKGNQEFVEQMKSLQSDLFVVVAFRILPKEIFEIPRYGSFNLHASLLPKYRGAAPIQWALINGETETGLTTFKLAEKVDTGNIYLQEKIPIYPEDDFGTLHDKLSELGADVVLRTIEMIESGNYQLLQQDDSLASFAPKITKEICRIDWNKSA